MFSGAGWRERMGSTAQNFQLGTSRMTEEQLADYQKNQPGTFIVWHFLDESDPNDLAMLEATRPTTSQSPIQGVERTPWGGSR